MNINRKSRLFTLVAGLLLIGSVACIDSPLAPQVKGKRSVRDTSAQGGDSTLCRSGWQQVGGRIVCNEEQ